MTRRESRKHLFLLLFQRDFYETEEYANQIEIYCQEHGVQDGRDKEYIKLRLASLVSHLSEIDDLIEENAKGWKLDRIAKAELSILRVAVFEAVFDEGIPVGVAINEAVELSKEYGGDHAPSFVNGILGKIVNE